MSVLLQICCNPMADDLKNPQGNFVAITTQGNDRDIEVDVFMRSNDPGVKGYEISYCPFCGSRDQVMLVKGPIDVSEMVPTEDNRVKGDKPKPPPNMTVGLPGHQDP